MNGGLEFCVYMTPCGYCSKFDKWCEKKCKNKYKNKGKLSMSSPEPLMGKNWKLNRGMF